MPVLQDTGKYVFGVADTLTCLDMGAVETLVVWEDLQVYRYELMNTVSGEELQLSASSAAVGGSCRSPWHPLAVAHAAAVHHPAGGHTAVNQAGSLPAGAGWEPAVHSNTSSFCSPSSPDMRPIMHPPGDMEVKHLNKEQESDDSHFKDKDGTLLEVKEKTSLLEWLANNYRKFGCALEFVSNK